MTQAAQSMLDALLQFSVTDREELAARLAESLDPDGDEVAGTEWDEEIQARAADVRAGRVKPVSWATARAQILDDTDG